MDVHDGFIVGIFNYCDRWCETCAFTSRCQVFADIAAFEAGLDPNLKAIVDAPPLPQDVPPPPPKWLQDCIDEMNEASREVTAEVALKHFEDEIAPEHKAIEQRARAYSFGTAGWLQTAGSPPERDYVDPRSVLAHFCALIPVKIYRALTALVLAREEPEDWPPDHDGTAKVALLAIDRSRAAWIDVVERDLAKVADVEPFVSELGFLADELERVFPRARAFVRPAFDEPEEVAKLA